MQRDLIQVPPAMPFLEIQRLFITGHIGGAPVVDEHGTVLGVIAASDLLQVIDQICDEDIDRNASEGDAAVAGSSDDLPERLGDITAIDMLTPEVVWVSADAPVAHVAHVMRTEGIHRVLVGNESRLEGILTAFDLLTALAGSAIEDVEDTTAPLPRDAEPRADGAADAASVRMDRELRPGFGHVVVGLDFSPRAKHALERAMRLPLQIGGILEMVHAIDEERFPAIVAHRELEARQLLDEARDRAERSLPSDGIHDVVATFDWGAPFKIIADRAHHGRAELVVVGRRRERQLGDVIAGSTSDRVIRNGSVPVLVVADPPSAPYRRPLVALDMSDTSRLALELAARLCDPSEGSIDVVHVISVPSRSHATRATHEHSVRAEVAAFVASVNAGVRWNIIVKFGEPVAAILDEASLRGADLIALGTRGRGRLARTLLGSVAEGVLRNTTRDVLVAKLPEV